MAIARSFLSWLENPSSLRGIQAVQRLAPRNFSADIPAIMASTLFASQQVLASSSCLSRPTGLRVALPARPAQARTSFAVRAQSSGEKPQAVQPINGDPFIGSFETPVTSAPIVATYLSNLPAYRTGEVAHWNKYVQQLTASCLATSVSAPALLSVLLEVLEQVRLPNSACCVQVYHLCCVAWRLALPMDCCSLVPSSSLAPCGMCLAMLRRLAVHQQLVLLPS